MMERKDIGELFKERLDSLEDMDISQDWDEMDLKLHKLKFYKFSLTNFNIYYCSLIILTFAFTSTVFIKTFFIDKNLDSDANQSQSENPIAIVDSKKKDLPENLSADNLKKTEINRDKNSKDPSSPYIAKAKSLNKEKTTLSESVIQEKGEPTLLGKEKPSVSDQLKTVATDRNKLKNGVANTVDNTSNNRSSAIANNSQKSVTSVTNSTSTLTNTSIDNQSKTLINSTNLKDTLKIKPVPKKKVVYVMKQDTIELVDTLRRKKPFKRK